MKKIKMYAFILFCIVVMIGGTFLDYELKKLTVKRAIAESIQDDGGI